VAGVLVTGAAGFLGSAVCRAALAEGAEVTGLVRAGELLWPIEGVTYRELDWADTASVTAALSEAAPERVVHCAGATPRARMSTAELYEANVALVWRLLDAVKAVTPQAGVVVVSSAAVYGPSPSVPTAEEEPLNPVTHYAWSKVLAEQAVRAFAGADGVRVCIARPFNLVGAGEPKGSVVSDVIEQIEAGADVIRVRETVSIRDYVDVSDAGEALLVLSERGAPGEAYNVCSGVGVSVAEIVQTILHARGSGAEIETSVSGVPGTVSTGSREKMRMLGWGPRASLPESVARAGVRGS